MGIGLTAALINADALAQDEPMSFFITSENPGKGADLGGLEGADAHCDSLAEAAGSELTGWKAYLSVNAVIDRSGDQAKVIPGVNARDRIGAGPWHNAKGDLIASDIDELHSDANAISKETGLDENGNTVNARTDKPNLHDILTGSDPEGCIQLPVVTPAAPAGPAAMKDQRSLATMTVLVLAMIVTCCPGTRRMAPLDAVLRRCRAPVAAVCFTVFTQLTDLVVAAASIEVPLFALSRPVPR